MEAASARYAARDRFGPFGEPAQTPLQRYIQNAVDPQNYEPNLALNLEVADLINQKKGNSPREAAVAIVNFVNHRNANVSLLALSLLDICVKNCGYPFHLQISTKEFLNELVRRFPERPPFRPSRVQMRILELIEEWRQTICQTSRYKEDLGFVRDMHRLLSVKGYAFPAVRREDAAVLNRSENLQSADEMEEEERAAQSAKLQELIRRGGPQDLQEANRLMKVMAGYDNKHKTDYRAKAAEEVGKIQAKAKLLEERLQNFKPGDKIADGDVFEELASALKSAHPKIQKMCEEESDDSEAIAKLLEINDSIHRTIERYELIKKGDLDGAAKIPKGTLGTSTGVTKTADNELSLIDLDPETSNESSSNLDNSQQQASVENDLLSLSIQDHNYGQTGDIALGGSVQPSQSNTPSTSQILQQPTPQSRDITPSRANYDAFSSLTSSSPSPGLPTVSASPKPPQQPNLLASAASDPFAGLNPGTPRQVSPQPQIPQATKPSASLFDFSAPSPNPVIQAPNPTVQGPNGSTADDDWDFASALPEESQAPLSNVLIVSNTSVKIVFKASRPETPPDSIIITASFSNNTPSPITELAFQFAVTKGFSLQLTPQSGRVLNANQIDGVTQPIKINGVPRGQSNAVKMRWKASYKLAGQLHQEQGEVPNLGIA